MYGGVNLPRHAKPKREVSKEGVCQRNAGTRGTLVTLPPPSEKTCPHGCTRVVRYACKCKKDKKQKTWC